MTTREILQAAKAARPALQGADTQQKNTAQKRDVQRNHKDRLHQDRSLCAGYASVPLFFRSHLVTRSPCM